MKLRLIAAVCLTLLAMKSFSEDKKFYIFICFGQSNMEGNARVQAQDTIGVDSRFQVLQAVDCAGRGRTKDNWYTAIPPLVRCGTGLTPADYFGRTLLANLPGKIKIGIINVSVAGAKIEVFETNSYQSYLATAPVWMKNIVAEYGGNPYERLLALAKLAQKSGVIKGVLLQQGESNTNDTLWTQKVKGVYDNLMKDLKLKPKKVPLLAGEVVNADQNGVCASMNKIIATLPQTIPNSYVISSAGCPCSADHLHFTAEGYRLLGRRYGETMLSLLGYKVSEINKPELSSVNTITR
ncbi:sialate O-acetylesterase [Mucilaginibacter sp. BT774]|uniref:sialate O-acetylesterase n=1 Tax=Mucilaginibacter sp. BT774 TaxID=3062276 RepID=UPI0026769370|nr:sialate O-acetylesterase [Mucilaginibacter sp. BT774]MDO3628010.1 sialate O-acetylesterase [Mucilaginibacter sp. BT774]